MPKSESSRREDPCSKILITNLSPWRDGNVETLMSIALCPKFNENLPSWGTRFLAMSSWAITLTRETKTGDKRDGKLNIS